MHVPKTFKNAAGRGPQPHTVDLLGCLSSVVPPNSFYLLRSNVDSAVLIPEGLFKADFSFSVHLVHLMVSVMIDTIAWMSLELDVLVVSAPTRQDPPWPSVPFSGVAAPSHWLAVGIPASLRTHFAPSRVTGDADELPLQVSLKWGSRCD